MTFPNATAKDLIDPITGRVDDATAWYDTVADAVENGTIRSVFSQADEHDTAMNLYHDNLVQVVRLNGAWVEWQTVGNAMDAEIVEMMNDGFGPSSDDEVGAQGYLDLYRVQHAAKHGQEFSI